MQHTKNILKQIEGMIEVLARPLPPSELANGWSSESQAAWLSFFRDIHQKFANGKRLPPMQHMVRAMDHWGIIGGDLLKKAARIYWDLEKLKDSQH